MIQGLPKKIKVAIGVFDELNFKELSSNNTVLIMRCDSANAMFYEKRFHKLNANINEFFFLLPDKMYSFSDQFQVAINCSFKEFLRHKT